MSDGTWTYTWKHGRQLASMTGSGVTWNYTYDADGMRKTRSNGSTTYSYVYNGGQLSQMTVGNNTLTFAYDVNGTPAGVTYNGVNYCYLTNLQGDIFKILDANCQIVAEYTYDAWGKILSITGSMASTLGTLNPLRYRGYVYDQETGLYYLQSRYYAPEIGRFINADAFTSTGQGLSGNNMFAYCGNNPVIRKDDGGEFWEIVAGAAIGGAIAGAFIGAVSHVVSCGVNGSSISASGLLGAIAVGAGTGALGAIGGVVEGFAITASLGVGIISGVSTAINTEGSASQKVVAGIAAGAIAAGGTYLGTKIPIAKDTAFTTGVTSFAGGLFMGTQTEIVSVAAQQVVPIIVSNKNTSSRSLMQLKRGRMRNVLKEY